MTLNNGNVFYGYMEKIMMFKVVENDKYSTLDIYTVMFNNGEESL